MQNEIVQKIVKILNKRKPIHVDHNQKIENYNFIENGHVDSIGLIKFIFEIEEKFKITLSEKDTLSKNFGKILGLSKIIKSKIDK